LLSVEGYPFVYAKDYFPASVWPGAYGLWPWIDNLVWVHEHLANGGTVTRYLDDKVIVLNRTGSPGLLTALNFDTLNERTTTCDTSFGPNVRLHDYTGKHPDITTGADGGATFTVPSNASARGQSYLCFSHAGLDAVVSVKGRSTTQTILGAADLDTMPALNTPAVAGRISVGRNSPISLSLHPNRSGWHASSQMRAIVTDAAGHALIDIVATGDHATANAHASIEGRCEVRIEGTGLPEGGSNFELDLTYTGPQTV
jgi:alpha-amylase